ncbi:MAG: Mur ligase family protein, partial [Thermoguttaceae bacterium]
MQVCPGLGHLESLRKLSDQLKIIGVTGRNGKTTTSCLIAGVLAHAGHKVGLLSTLGYFDGEDVEYAAEATPQADRLATLLARMVRNGCSHAVMNVSNRALAQSRVAGVSYDAACVTNVTRDHLYGNAMTKDYRPAGCRLFDHLRDEAFVVLNVDDPLSAGYLRQINGPALTVGIDSPAEITGTPIEQFPSVQTFLITAGSDTMPVQTQMIGRHHIYNCLTATAVGLAYGIELPRIVRSLEAAHHVPGRLERIECGQPFSVFVDFAHTPDALAGCLQTLKTVT